MWIISTHKCYQSPEFLGKEDRCSETSIVLILVHDRIGKVRALIGYDRFSFRLSSESKTLLGANLLVRLIGLVKRIKSLFSLNCNLI